MPATISIRKAVTADLQPAHNIFNQSRRAAGCFPPSETTFEDFVTQVEGEEMFLACTGNQITGFVSIWAADHFIHHLYVAPDAQHRGMGAALILHCRQTYGLPLSLKCDLANVAAQTFYQYQGFQPGEECGTDVNGRWVRLWLTAQPAEIICDHSAVFPSI